MPGCKRRKSNKTNYNSIKLLKCIKFQQKNFSYLSPADMPMTVVQPKAGVQRT